MPHDTRSNTATFLEGVISYIQTLQQSNAQLEAELSAVKALRAAAAANLQQQQQLEVLAQPAGSGSNPAESTHHPSAHQQQLHSQHQYHASSWRQDSITGPPPLCADAAAAAAGHWQPAAAGAPMLVDGEQELVVAMQAQQQQQQQAQQSRKRTSSAMHSGERQALSCSPTHAAAAVAGPSCAQTLSAPAALMHSLIQQSTPTTTAAATGPFTGPASTGGGPVQPQLEAVPLQPAELQGVLERALLAALQQQAQHLASQMRSSNA